MENDEFSVSDLTKDLIAYTVVNSPAYKPPEIGYYELTDMQKEYLQGMIQRKRPIELCEKLGLSRVQPKLWAKQNKLFAESLELIQDMKADDLEDSMWNEAMLEGANPIVKMFLLKQAKPSYRDNATPPTVNSINIRVSVGDKDFKVVADATPDNDLD